MGSRCIFGIFLLLLFSSSAKAQYAFGAGASAIYNFQSESFGAGLRGSFFTDKPLSITPQFSYFFPFNKVHEFTLGLGLEYKFLHGRYLNYYGILHGGYNRWMSYERSTLEHAKPNNWNLEGGIGVAMTRCIRPFAEYRYNLKFQETHLSLGVLFLFECWRYRSDRNSQCPAYH